MWCGLLQVTARGDLRLAVGTEQRAHLVPIYNGTETAIALLEETWGHRMPSLLHAIDALKQPSVAATHAADKELLLRRLGVLHGLMRRVNSVNTAGSVSVDRGSGAVGASGAVAGARAGDPMGDPGGASVPVVFGIGRAVGPKPSTHTWRDEWVDACMERDDAQGTYAPRSWYEGGSNKATSGSIAAILKSHATLIQWQVEVDGWAREHAEAYTAIANSIAGPIATAVHQRRVEPAPLVYAASTHTLCEALATQAKRLSSTEAAPLVYAPLTGDVGLATHDDAWHALLDLTTAEQEEETEGSAAATATASASLSSGRDGGDGGTSGGGVCFVTDGIITAALPDEKLFPDDGMGFAARMTTRRASTLTGLPLPDNNDRRSNNERKSRRGSVAASTVPIYVPQDSDLVCFRSAPSDADGHHHSLVRVDDAGTHAAPPLTTVTLESVQGAGEWMVMGHPVMRRLFTVSVAWHK